MPRRASVTLGDMCSRRRASSLAATVTATVVMVISMLTGCAAGMSRIKSGLNGTPGTIAMPDLFRMSKAEAVTTLKLAGHTGDVSWDDQLCGSAVEGKIIEKGDVCRQSPAAGQDLPAGAAVRLLVQPEDPRHGKVGQFGEWHLMPDVIGLPLDEAQAAMREAGFTDERTHVDEGEDAACRPRIVCKTYPSALERAGQASDRYLTVGVEPTARPVPYARPEPEAAPEPEPAPPPPPPPPKPPEGYF